MLTFLGLSFPDNPERDRLEAPRRAAKLKKLQSYFDTSDATAFYMLSEDALSKSNKKRGDILVINSHGNAHEFARYRPDAFLDMLTSKGFEEGSFKAIYLMACRSAQQPEDNGALGTFAVGLKRLLNMRGIDCKVYGTRGNLSYTLEEHDTDGGMTYFEATDMWVKSPTITDPETGKPFRYNMEEGILLAQVA